MKNKTSKTTWSAFLLALTMTILCAAACSSDDDKWQQVENDLEGVWKTEMQTNEDPYAVVQHTFTLTKVTGGIQGSLSHYTIEERLANGTTRITDRGDAGHPNGEPSDTWTLRNRNGEKTVRVIFLNRQHTTMRFESKCDIVRDIFHKQQGENK